MPIRRFSLDTHLPRGAAVQRLRATLLALTGDKDADFSGSVDDDSFRLIPESGGRMNSFMPRIRGRIDTTPSGTRVSGTMFLHPFTMCFLLVWIGLIGWQMWHERDARTLLVIGMLVFLPSLGVASFYFEAAKAERCIVKAMVEKLIPCKAAYRSLGALARTWLVRRLPGGRPVVCFCV
jgi:hypothetical protein